MGEHQSRLLSARSVRALPPDVIEHFTPIPPFLGSLGLQSAVDAGVESSSESGFIDGVHSNSRHSFTVAVDPLSLRWYQYLSRNAGV